MSRTRGRRPVVGWVVIAVCAFALGVGLTWMLWSFSTLVGGQGAGDAARPDGSFTISGDLTEPVSPGVMVPLDLSVSNPHDDALIVADLTVTVESVDAPNATESRPCNTDDFVVEQLSINGLLLGAGETRTLAELQLAPEDWPQVGMIDAESNQDGCKAASLALVYTATGRFDT